MKTNIFRHIILLLTLIICSCVTETQKSNNAEMQYVNGIKPEGRFKSRYENNKAYLLKVYDDYKSFMLDPFVIFNNRPPSSGFMGKYYDGKYPGWEAEYAFKWLDAASNMLYEDQDYKLKEKVAPFADTLLKLQRANGYIGIESDSTIFSSEWNIWCLWYAITGYLSFYETSGDKRYLDGARKAAGWVMDNYSIHDGKHNFYKGALNGGCNLDIIDQFVRLYAITHDDRYRKFVHDAVDNYPLLQQMKEEGKVKYIHSYVLSAYLGGVVMLANLENDKPTIAWVDKLWQDMVNTHLYPTGSMGYKEYLQVEGPNDIPVSESNVQVQQETCTTVEWMLLNQRLFASTGNAKYMDEIEKTIYNALLAAQSIDGMKWNYYTALRYEKKWFSFFVRCCYYSGPRGIALLPKLIYSAKEKAVFVNLFEKSSMKTSVQNKPVSINQVTNFPDEGGTSLNISVNGAAEFELKIRIPEWAKDIKAYLNKQAIETPLFSDGYLVVNRTWNNNDNLSLKFDIPTYFRVLKGWGVTLCRGAEVMSVNKSDNPDIELDNILLTKVIDLQPVISNDGRRKYKASVLVKGRNKEVIFTPYADAGNDGTQFRTVFPCQY